LRDNGLERTIGAEDDGTRVDDGNGALAQQVVARREHGRWAGVTGQRFRGLARALLVAAVALIGCADSAAQAVGGPGGAAVPSRGGGTSQATISTSPQTFDGTLLVVWGDPHPDFGGAGEIRYTLALSDGSGRLLPLQLAGQENVAALHFNKPVIVTGQLAAGTSPLSGAQGTAAIVVDTIAPSPTLNAVADSAAAVFGTKRVLYLLVKFSDDVAVPHGPTFYSNLNNPDTPPAGEVFPATVNGFFKKTSWNQFSWLGDVGGVGGIGAPGGWLTLPHPKSYYAPCGWSGTCANLNALGDDATALGKTQGITFTNYDNINFVLSNDLDCCAWGGGYSLDGKAYGATWEPPWGQEAGTYAHEMGHSLGLPHSGWVYYAYDSPWDMMSDRTSASDVVCGSYFSANSAATSTLHCSEPGDGYITAHKDYLGWIPPANAVATDTLSNVTATLEGGALPLGAAAKMIKICLAGVACTGSAAHYITVEARVKGIGTSSQFDNAIPGEGVIVHDVRFDRAPISGTCYFNNQSGWAVPVDSTAGDYNSAGCDAGGRSYPDYALLNAQFLPGQTYSNSTYGLNIAVLSRTGSTFVVATYVRPAVTTNAAGAIGATGATLNGTVSSNGASTTATFQYGLTTGYGSTATAAQSPLAAGATGAATSGAITGLTCNRLYHFRAVAANSAGTTNGNDATFTTAACPPTATTGTASAVRPAGATLNGIVSSNGTGTTVTFQYGLTTGYGSTATAAQSPLAAGASSAATSAAITGLTCNRLYHFRVVAANSAGTTNGNDATFTTGPCPPTAATNGASAINATGATLNGTVSSNGTSTTVTFQYGLTTGYGRTVTAAQSPLAAGASGAATSAAITGLTCNRLYHFRVVATSPGGTTNGTDATFTTAACPPTVTTNAASAISATGAMLNGSLTSNGASTTVTFQYGLTTGYGSTATAAQSPLAAGASGAATSAAVMGLTCNRLYHYRAVAANSAGTTNGTDATFTTGACTPTAVTDPANGGTATGATLTGTVSSNGASTTVTFQYGLTIGYGNSATAAQSPLAAGASGAAVAAAITGLTCNTPYHFRVVAASSAGTANGTDAMFTTGPCPPTTATNAASAIGANGATLNGTVSSNGASTTVTFQYGLTIGYGNSATAAQSPLAAGASGAATSAAITGLNCNTPYHFRVVAANSAGTTNAVDGTFTTAPCTPTAVTDVANGITATAATLNGTVSSNGASTTVTFHYGLTASYGSMAPAIQSPLAAGASAAATSAAITGLTCNTPYHFRVVAASSAGTTNGTDATFTTGPCLPTAATNAASAIGATSATLNGTVSSNGASTTATFQYGLTTGYGSTVTAAQSPLAAGASGAATSAPITGLTCNTPYHFRVVAASSAGTTNGTDATFTTAPCPVVNVTLIGNGTGTVTSSPTGIRCGADCSESFPTGTRVTLTATSAAGSVFIGWGGACSATLICTLAVASAADVAATFTSLGAGSAGSNEWVQKSYVAYYGRPADPDGLAYWARRMDAEGGSLASIIGSFGTSDEFNRRYGGLGYVDLVTRIYQQTLGRDPEPAGLDFYVSELQAGRRTLQSITLDVLNGATGADALTVAHRVDVANHYTGKVALGCAYGSEQVGVGSLAPVTPDPATVAAAKMAIESRCGL